MSLDIIIKYLFVFSSCGLLSIGYFYDERLDIFGINLSLIITFLYALSGILLIFRVRQFKLNIPKFSIYFFFGILILTTPLLWLHFGYNEYGIKKYLVLSLFILPTVFIILETFSKQDVNLMLWVVFSVSCLLMILGIFYIDQSSELQGGRMSVMGGGPIVFARWMIIGSLIIFFHPKMNFFLKLIFISIFLGMAFTAGSRGPFYALIIIITGYYLITIIKNYFKIIVFISFLALFLSIETFQDKENSYGASARVFNQDIGSGYARKDRIVRSSKLLFISPLGVGSGNWAQESNKVSKNNHPDKEYPHNIFLELANEFGIISSLLLIIVLYFSVSFFLTTIKHPKNYLEKIFFILFIYMLLNSMISGDLIDSRFFFIFLAIYLSLLHNKNTLLTQKLEDGNLEKI